MPKHSFSLIFSAVYYKYFILVIDCYCVLCDCFSSPNFSMLFIILKLIIATYLPALCHNDRSCLMLILGHQDTGCNEQVMAS